MDFHEVLTGFLQSLGIETGHMLYPVILLVISEFLGFRKSAKSNNTPQLIVNIAKSVTAHFFKRNTNEYTQATDNNYLIKK